MYILVLNFGFTNKRKVFLILNLIYNLNYLKTIVSRTAQYHYDSQLFNLLRCFENVFLK